ncbi:hypothetical protein ACSSVY_002571 [Roseovarius sp. MBR-51]
MRYAQSTPDRRRVQVCAGRYHLGAAGKAIQRDVLHQTERIGGMGFKQQDLASPAHEGAGKPRVEADIGPNVAKVIAGAQGIAEPADRALFLLQEGDSAFVFGIAAPAESVAPGVAADLDCHAQDLRDGKAKSEEATGENVWASRSGNYHYNTRKNHTVTILGLHCRVPKITQAAAFR